MTPVEGQQICKVKGGKFVKDVVLSKDFWKGIVIKGANPLIEGFLIIFLSVSGRKPILGGNAEN